MIKGRLSTSPLEHKAIRMRRGWEVTRLVISDPQNPAPGDGFACSSLARSFPLRQTRPNLIDSKDSIEHVLSTVGSVEDVLCRWKTTIVHTLFVASYEIQRSVHRAWCEIIAVSLVREPIMQDSSNEEPYTVQDWGSPLRDGCLVSHSRRSVEYTSKIFLESYSLEWSDWCVGALSTTSVLRVICSTYIHTTTKRHHDA
jgi:hypothetical protein